VQIPPPSSPLLLPPQSRSKPPGFEDPRLIPLPDSEVTPTYLFYRIDINPVVPVVDATSWSLNVKGLVNNPLTISYEDIKSMPSIERRKLVDQE
jgi:DMSO/TMAO reductase YedYZ molybdopterin-dependent catalytic subunit